MSIAELMEVPLRKNILIIGPPGAGKSTFCKKVILQNLAVNRPVIFITTEYDSAGSFALASVIFVHV